MVIACKVDGGSALQEADNERTGDSSPLEIALHELRDGRQRTDFRFPPYDQHRKVTERISRRNIALKEDRTCWDNKTPVRVHCTLHYLSDSTMLFARRPDCEDIDDSLCARTSSKPILENWAHSVEEVHLTSKSGSRNSVFHADMLSRLRPSSTPL